MFDFNPNYVGLIGSDLFARVNANIDFRWMHIQTESTIVPFFYNQSKLKQEIQRRNECNFTKLKSQSEIIKHLSIPARSEIQIKLPTTSTNGTRVCEKIKFNNHCFTPRALVKVHNNYFYTTAINTANEPQHFQIYNPLVLKTLKSIT